MQLAGKHHNQMVSPTRVARRFLAVSLTGLLVACGTEVSVSPADTTGGATTTTPPAERIDRVADMVTAVESNLAGGGLEAWAQHVPEAEEISLTASSDGEDQPAIWLAPDGPGEQPLIVMLHSWSSRYDQAHGVPFARWAADQGWAFIQPEFRGPFRSPEATGSDIAVADVVDAVTFATDHEGVDPGRVYAVGFSGGGMMAMLMAGRHPELFAGASSWGGIYDLVGWYGESEPDSLYPDDIEASCGGDPTADPGAREDCRHRSPVSHLDGAREGEVPMLIGHGIDDEVVGPQHSITAFNHLAAPGDRVGAEILEGSRPADQPPSGSYFTSEDPDVLEVRSSGPVTLVLFDGGHDMAYHPALAWFAELAGD